MGINEAVWAIALAAVGGGLCFVPLFDVLGYEWCLVMALLASLAGAQLGAAHATTRRLSARPCTRRPGAIVARLFGAVTARVWLMLIPPFVAVVANAARVRNCDLATGFLWFALLPLASAAMGTALGVVVGLAYPWQRARWPALIAVGGIACSLVYAAVHAYRQPPVFAYDPFFGYFAGGLYDEDVQIRGALGWARLYQVSLAAAALSACALLLDVEALAIRRRAPVGRRASWVMALAAAGVAMTLHAARARLGFALDLADVAHALGAEKRTAHFVLHYSPTGPYAARIDEYAADAEFRWAQHARLFPRTPPVPVHAFLFDSPTQKRALVGLSNTMFTRGWRQQTYLHFTGFPQFALAHELAHIFAAQFGDPLFGASHHGLHVTIGLGEGVAVAAAWREYAPWQPLTPHQIVKVLRDAHLVDDDVVATVMGPRFLTLSDDDAYAVAGSFCRFLLDTRGIDKLMAIHRAGGSDEAWRRIYGVDLAALAAEWWRLIDAQQLSVGDRAFALAWLRRPSIFGRPCAHTVAVERQQASTAARAGDRVAALAAWRNICDRGLAEPRDLAEASVAALVAGKPDEARRLAVALLSRSDAGDVLRAAAETMLGDVALLADDVDEARAAYDRAGTLPMNDWLTRTLALKRLLCAWPAGAARTTLARALIIAEREDLPRYDLGELRALVRRQPGRRCIATSWRDRSSRAITSPKCSTSCRARRARRPCPARASTAIANVSSERPRSTSGNMRARAPRSIASRRTPTPTRDCAVMPSIGAIAAISSRPMCRR